MGRIYRDQIERKIKEIGVANVRAFVNPLGFEAQYRDHIVETLRDLGVMLVCKREQANFVLDGKASPQFQEDQITAYLNQDDRRMVFAGSVGLG